MLTVHGVDALQRVEIVYADSAVSDQIRALAQAEIRDLEATPADTAKAMLTEARAGASVVRLVAGDVFIDDHAVRETLAVARTVVPFDIVPGLSIAAGTAAYAGVPVGFVHSEADRGALHVRRATVKLPRTCPPSPFGSGATEPLKLRRRYDA